MGGKEEVRTAQVLLAASRSGIAKRKISAYNAKRPSSKIDIPVGARIEATDDGDGVTLEANEAVC